MNRDTYRFASRGYLRNQDGRITSWSLAFTTFVQWERLNSPVRRLVANKASNQKYHVWPVFDNVENIGHL